MGSSFGGLRLAASLDMMPFPPLAMVKMFVALDKSKGESSQKKRRRQ
jgi:hypothetical protein